MSWLKRMKRAFYTVTIRVPFFLRRTQCIFKNEEHIVEVPFHSSLLESEQLILEKIRGIENPANILTKGVTIEQLKLCSASVGLRA